MLSHCSTKGSQLHHTLISNESRDTDDVVLIWILDLFRASRIAVHSSLTTY